MNAVSGGILLVLLIIVTVGSRRWALLAMMVGVFFLTQGHSVQMLGLNLYPVRFLEAAAFGRVLGRRELVRSQLNRMDWTLLALYNYTALVWVVRSSEFAAEQFGFAVDATLCYLALRGLINGLDDLRWLLNALVAVLAPYTVLVYLERRTGQSAFTIIGATPTLYFRDDVARCQGTFRHAILLGTVAASFLSLYVGQLLAGSRRMLAGLGVGLCITLVALSNSGGPLTSAMAALFGWLLWPLRNRMFLVRRAALGLLVFLLLFMKAPIWYLPFKISEIFGGGGYHRGLLMERAWQDLGKWWVAGMDIKETAGWFPYIHNVIGGADITNQFVSFGLSGGLMAIVLSLVLFSLAFSGLGSALSATDLSDGVGRANGLLFWGLGITLWVHAVSWLGVSYYDQSWVVWLMHVAAISGSVHGLQVTQPTEAARARSRPLSARLGDRAVRRRLARVTPEAEAGIPSKPSRPKPCADTEA